MQVAKLEIGFIEVPNCVSLDIYAVGCRNNCPNCHNPQLRDFNYPKRFTLTEKAFVEKIEDSSGLIDGVCWLGGDCFYQPSAYKKLTRLVKETNCELFNCLYTGVDFEIIDSEMLIDTDIVIDGRWEGKVISDPETNQRIFKKINNEWKKITYEEFSSYSVEKCA